MLQPSAPRLALLFFALPFDEARFATAAIDTRITSGEAPPCEHKQLLPSTLTICTGLSAEPFLLFDDNFLDLDELEFLFSMVTSVGPMRSPSSCLFLFGGAPGTGVNEKTRGLESCMLLYSGDMLFEGSIFDDEAVLLRLLLLLLLLSLTFMLLLDDSLLLEVFDEEVFFSSSPIFPYFFRLRSFDIKSSTVPFQMPRVLLEL